MSYIVLMQNMPLGVGLKGEVMERLLMYLWTAGWARAPVSKLKKGAKEQMDEK